MIELSRGDAARIQVGAGQLLEVRVLDGAPIVDLAIAGMHQGLTRNVAGWRRFRRPSLALWLAEGEPVVDGDGAVLAELAESPGDGQVDISYPGCWREIYPDGRAGCRDLLAEALGCPRAALPGVLSLFGAPADLSEGGVHGWQQPVRSRPYARARLRVHRSLEVAVSGCPDDAIPGASGGRFVAGVLQEV